MVFVVYIAEYSAAWWPQLKLCVDALWDCTAFGTTAEAYDILLDGTMHK